MYLVDTSIWVDYLRGKSNKPIQMFLHILDERIPFGLSACIYQEVLQSASTEKDFKKLEEYLSTQIFYHPKSEIVTYKSAAKLYFNGRKKGITIRSTIDCLIAQIAVEHKLTLLHNDNDFIKLKKIIPSLKLA